MSIPSNSVNSEYPIKFCLLSPIELKETIKKNKNITSAEGDGRPDMVNRDPNKLNESLSVIGGCGTSGLCLSLLCI